MVPFGGVWWKLDCTLEEGQGGLRPTVLDPGIAAPSAAPKPGAPIEGGGWFASASMRNYDVNFSAASKVVPCIWPKPGQIWGPLGFFGIETSRTCSAPVGTRIRLASVLTWSVS